MPHEPLPSRGQSVRKVLGSLVGWGLWSLLPGVFVFFFGHMVFYSIDKGKWGWVAGFGVLCALALWGLLASLKVLVRSVWSGLTQLSTPALLEGSEEGAPPSERLSLRPQAMASPGGAWGHLLFLLYVLVFHDPWVERIASLKGQQEVDWLTLAVVLFVLVADHVGTRSMLMSLSKGALSFGMVFVGVLRGALLMVFCCVGAVAANWVILKPEGGLTETAGAVAGAFVLVIMVKEGWLWVQVTSRSEVVQKTPWVGEIAQWIGAVGIYALVEVLLFSAPAVGLQPGAPVNLFASLLLFSFFWVPLQMPQLARHFSSRTSVMQELSWWATVVAVYASVGRQFWLGV